MTMIALPGLTYQGHPCSYDDGQTTTPPVQPPTTQPPTQPGTTVYPPELQTKHKSNSAMPWTSGTRLNGPTITHDTAWIVNFRSGAASSRDVRLTAIQREGGPIRRIAVLFRRSDGAVVGRIDSSSISFYCLVGQPPKQYRVSLEANTNYALGIYNFYAEQGAMFCDLYL